MQLDWPQAARCRELELVLGCCRPRPQPAVLRDLVRPVGLNWHALQELAMRHHVQPLVTRALVECCADLVPVDALDGMRAHGIALQLANDYMLGQLLSLLTMCRQAGIPGMAFKGPLLALELDGNTACRDFGDLDVLIRPNDVARVTELLTAHGFRADLPFDDEQNAFVAGLRGWRKVVYLQSRSEHHFIRTSDSLVVDLHLMLADPYIWFPLAFEELWRTGHWIQVGTHRVRVFAPEHMLLVLCLNGAKDGWERLQRTRDIAQLLETNPDLDQQAVVRGARRLGAVRMLRVSLMLAQQLLGAKIPEHLASGLTADAVAHTVARDATFRMFQLSERRPELTVAYAKMYVRTRERLRDRLWFYLRLGLGPDVADWRVARLPIELGFLYVLIRPVRLTWTVARRSALAIRLNHRTSRSPGH